MDIIGDDGCAVCHVAPVQVRVMNPANHDLGFCNHHFADNEIRLIAQGFVVVEDTRDSLLEKKPSE